MGRFVKVASVGDIPAGQGQAFKVDGQEIAVFNAQGAYYALDDICTHEEASLAEGDVEGCAVECPLHGARFDLRSGKVLSLPATVPAKTYPTRVVGSDIEIEV